MARTTPWKPGQSGNPAGRPKGIKNPQAKLREAIAAHLPAIIDEMVASAKAGDVGAARLLVERVLPPVRAMEMPQVIPMPGQTLTEQGRAVLEAVSAGVLAPGQGGALIAAIGQLARVAEIDELAKRIEVLEAKGGPQPDWTSLIGTGANNGNAQ